MSNGDHRSRSWSGSTRTEASSSTGSDDSYDGEQQQQPWLPTLAKWSLTGVHLALDLAAPLAWLTFATTTTALLFAATFHFVIDHRLALTVLSVYALVECLFHLRFIRLRHALASPDAHPAFPVPTLPERKRLLDGIMSSFPTVPERRAWAADWFYRAPSPDVWDGRSGDVAFEELRRGNVEDLLAAVLFSSRVEDLCPSAAAQLREDVDRLEDDFEARFEQGRDEGVQCMRHLLEPIRTDHRPLAFYLLVYFARFVVEGVYLAFGWRRHHVRVEGRTLGYWYHPGLDDRKAPVVVVTGLAGLVTVPHLAISLLLRTKRPIFLVGNESVSLSPMAEILATATAPEPDPSLSPPTDGDDPDPHLASPLWTTTSGDGHRWSPVPPVTTLCQAVRVMLRRHGFVTIREAKRKGYQGRREGGAIVLGHSLGTQTVSLLARQEGEQGWVRRSVFVDPICFWWPHLLRTFIYAEPRTAGEMFIRLVAREVGVATVIQRHFLWYTFAALAPPTSTSSASASSSSGAPPLEGYVPAKTAHFILAEHDALLKVDQAASYLDRVGIPHTRLPNAPHGGFLFTWPRLRTVVDIADSSPSCPSSSHNPVSRSVPPSPTLSRKGRRPSVSIRLPSTASIAAALSHLSPSTSPSAGFGPPSTYFDRPTVTFTAPGFVSLGGVTSTTAMPTTTGGNGTVVTRGMMKRRLTCGLEGAATTGTGWTTNARGRSMSLTA